MHPDQPVRDASTVCLLRDGPVGPEAWLLTRRTSLIFAAGMTVFPGGRVDESDADLPFVPGFEVGPVAARFGSDSRRVLALLGAAVRETYEETGVLLTHPVTALPEARADVEAGLLPFGSLLASQGLAVDPTGITPWARWVTPIGEPRRYDTHFFVLALPSGLDPADVTTESSAAGWAPIAHAVAEAERGERFMLPPTIITLGQMLPHATVADIVAAAPAQSLAAVRPVMRVEDGRRWITVPESGLTMSLPLEVG